MARVQTAWCLNGVPDCTSILICRSPDGSLQSLLLIAVIVTTLAALHPSARLSGSEGLAVNGEAQ